MSNFDLVKKMHQKFEIENRTAVGPLSKEEYLFRIGAMFEELWEYVGSVFHLPKGTEGADEYRKAVIDALSGADLKRNVGSPEMLEQQFDALVDLSVFNLGTAERQGFDFNEGFRRVMQANMGKELAGTSENSKRGFKCDLVKPEGWKPPVLIDLVKPLTGVIVLEGPDGTGKTSLADFLVREYGAIYIHNTWSPELQKNMDNYLDESIRTAKQFSKERLVVIDRHWISEFIYSDVFRQGTEYPEYAETAYKELNDLGAFYVFCMPYAKATIDKYFSEFEDLKQNREEMYSSMNDCFLAYYNFVMVGEYPRSIIKGYKLNTKENKCNFLGTRWPITEPAVSYLSSMVYDRFIDSNYKYLLNAITSRLKENN